MSAQVTVIFASLARKRLTEAKNELGVIGHLVASDELRYRCSRISSTSRFHRSGATGLCDSWGTRETVALREDLISR